MLGDNQIDGPIPTEIGQLKKLRYLRVPPASPTPGAARTGPRRRRYLYDNEIDGTFPSDLCEVQYCQANAGNPDLVAPCGTEKCCDLGNGAACPAPTVTPTATPSTSGSGATFEVRGSASFAGMTPEDAAANEGVFREAIAAVAGVKDAGSLALEFSAGARRRRLDDAPALDVAYAYEAASRAAAERVASSLGAATTSSMDAAIAAGAEDAGLAAAFSAISTASLSAPAVATIDAPTPKPTDVPTAKLTAGPTTAPTNLSQDAGEFGQGDGSFTEPDACSGLAKKTCKETAGCAYKKKTCSTSGGDACSACSGLVADTICKYVPKKSNCKKAGCRWNKKKEKCQRIKD